MKITSFLLLFVAFQAFSSNSYSQNAKVSLGDATLRVEKVLSMIESQTDYLFVYNKKNVDVRRTVEVKAVNKPVDELLDEVFSGTGVKYVMEGNNIVLTKAEAMRVNQQSRISVMGVITDRKGEPIIGANVLEKGTTNGVITDLDGHFKLESATNSHLVISYIGYKTQTIAVNGKGNLTIVLEEESLVLDNVVVTAMGIKKKEASLTYSNQQVNGNELTRAKDPNMINALAGKTAGVQISKSSSGLGGSAKVSIRGSRSISGNNQPLYVIDGIPMLNSTTEQAATAMGGQGNGANRDGGDGISNLNPDDIESMSILKGASAAALYGSQAANGVILITTKKGKAGLSRVTFSSNVTFDQAIELPEFQNTYGQDANKMSWGDKGKLKDYDNVDNFFQGGITAINSVSLTRGNEKVQNYFSYANTYGKGIIEGNSLVKHNFNFRETANFFDDYLKVDANVNLVSQTLKNRPTTGGYYFNPLVGLYGYPRGEDMAEYKTNFEKYDADRNMNIQNWYTKKQPDGWSQNPYWLINRLPSKDIRNRVIANLSATVKITDWLSIQARGTVDYLNDKFNQKMYASTAPEIAGTNGRYINLDHAELMLYGDVMAMFNKTWDNLSLNAAFGSSVNQTTVNSLRLDSHTASLYYPNVFTVSNIKMTPNAYIEESINQRRELQSVFATAQLGWKESLYLDLTARNDWSSTLAYTEKLSFFYPSVGLSWIINNSVKLPSWINFAKIRGSWSQVGNDLPLFVSNPSDQIVAGGVIQANDSAPFDKLKPELSTSYEVGMEWKFFNQRLDLDVTYYQSNTKNQLLTLPSPAGAQYKYFRVNAGDIENRGWEITLGATPIMTKDFRWKTGLNYAKNSNEIKALHPDLKSFLYGVEGFTMSYAMRLVEGGSFGDIYGTKYDRDDSGKIKTDDEGLPLSIGTGNTEKVGNSTPDYMLGWSNTFSYKGFSLYFLIDARVGGEVLSVTQAEMDYNGVSKESALSRNKGFVSVSGQKFDNVEAFYKKVGARTGCVTEQYMYSATNVRLRELSVGYSLPQSLLEKTKIIKGLDVSLVGRNLFFFSNKAPFDPDVTMSTDNSCQGINVFGMPTTRSLGFNVKFTF